MTPMVNAQKGFIPKVRRSLKRVESPIHRKQKTNAQDRSVLMGLMALE